MEIKQSTLVGTSHRSSDGRLPVVAHIIERGGFYALRGIGLPQLQFHLQPLPAPRVLHHGHGHGTSGRLGETSETGHRRGQTVVDVVPVTDVANGSIQGPSQLNVLSPLLGRHVRGEEIEPSATDLGHRPETHVVQVRENCQQYL